MDAMIKCVVFMVFLSCLAVPGTLGEIQLTSKMERYSDCSFLLIVNATAMGSTGQAVFYWFCALEVSSLPDDPANYDQTKKGCFGNKLKIQEGNSPYLVLKSSKVTVTCDITEYYIRVFHKHPQQPNPISSGTKFVVFNQFTPVIAIECQKNCDKLVNPTRKLVYIAKCMNCHGLKDANLIKFEWELLDSDINLKEISEDSGSGKVITPFELRPEETYTLQCTATLPDGSTSSAKMEFTTRQGLAKGTCTVDPQEGQSTKTYFTVTCQDFVHSDRYVVLEYTLQANMTDRRHLISNGDKPEMTVRCPPGNRNDDYNLPLILRVCGKEVDPLCAEVQLGTVKVTIEGLTIDELEEGINNMGAVWTDDRLQEAMQETLMTAAILNELNLQDAEDSTLDEYEKKMNLEGREKLRETLLEKVFKVTGASIKTLNQLSSILDVVTKQGDELSEQALNIGAGALDKMSKELLKVTSTAEELESTATSVLSAVSNLMEAMLEPDETPENETASKPNHKEVNQKLLSSMSAVGEAIAGHKVTGEEATHIRTPAFSMSVAKVSAADLGGSSVDIGTEDETTNSSSFSLPKQLPIPASEGDISVQGTYIKQNPFDWENSAKDVTTAVLQLTLKSGQYEVTMSNLPEPFKVEIPQDTSSEEPINITLRENFTTYAEFNKTLDESKVLLYISVEEGETNLVENASMDLSLFALTQAAAGVEENDKSLYDTIIILGGDSVQVLNTSSRGRYSLALKVNDSYLEGNASIKLYVSQIQCRYWSSNDDKWSTEGCDVGVDSTTSRIICYCTHLTSFAGGFLIMPNKLNFKEDMAKFLTPWENPVGMIAVGCVLIIYIIVVILARRKDKRDMLKGAVVNLADNNPAYEHNYIICVQTGSRRNSGSTANVVFVLIGDLGESEPHIMFSSSDDMCQGGKMDTLVIRTKESLGNIEQITFWHDNTGKSPEWFLSYCEVIDPQTGETYDFVCNCWLADCLGDNRTLKTFNVATDEEKKDLEFLFFTNANIGFKDQHMWFSTIAHQVDSCFTTVQRVSCCLSLFMTYMLCNIMFYGIEPESGGEQKLELGPTALTWTELRIGIMSAMIMVPVNVIIVTLFKRCKPRYARTLYHVHLDTLYMHLTMTDQDNSAKQALDQSVVESLKTFKETPNKAGKEITLRRHSTLDDNMGRGASGLSDETDAMLNNGPVPAKKRKKKKLEIALPWWFVYIGWVMLFIIVFTCGFFTILYSFNYGFEKSIKWLSALILAFTTDALFAQPMKVILMAFVISLIFKSTMSEVRSMNIDLDHTRIDGFYTTSSAEELRKSMGCYKPPEQHGRADGVGKDDSKVYGLFYEILRYLIFLYLVLLITYSRTDVNQYLINHFLSSQVISEEDLLSVGDLTSSWYYLNDTLIPGLFDMDQPEFVNDLASLRLSPPLLIQMRKEPCTIEPNHMLKKMGITGRHWMCIPAVEETRNFGLDWDLDARRTTSPWVYNITHQGYVVEMGRTYEEAMGVMSYLTDHLWADRYTTILLVKAVIYTAQLNLLSIVNVHIHLNSPVGVSMLKETSTFKMYRSTHSFHIFVLVLEVMYACYSLYFAYYVARSIFKQKSSYFQNVWSFLDLAVVFISFNVIIVYICHSVMVDRAVKTFLETGAVLMFDTVLMLEMYVAYSLALLVCCSMLKFLHMLRFNPIIYRFLAILNRAKAGLLWSGSVILLLFLQYGGMFHMVAAGKMAAFKNIGASFVTMFIAMLGEYDVKSLQEIHGFLAPVAMLTFLIASTVVGLNIMTSILIETLNRVNKEKLPNDEARLLELLIDRLLQWLGIKKRSEDMKNPAEEEENTMDFLLKEPPNAEKKTQETTIV